MAKVRPLHDRLLVKRIEETETVKGGIIIPDSAKEKPQEGEVIAVGNGKILDNGNKVALDVKAGDKILFGKYSGTDIKIDGEEYLILREDEVLAVIEFFSREIRKPDDELLRMFASVGGQIGQFIKDGQHVGAGQPEHVLDLFCH